MLYARRDGESVNGFDLNILAASRQQRIAGVTSFVGEDASGFFGIQAHHARLMTTLVFGLAKFSVAAGAWQYLALPGAVLYFRANALTLSTRHFLIDTDPEKIGDLLQAQFSEQHERLQTSRASLEHLEQAMLKRLLALQRNPEHTL